MLSDSVLLRKPALRLYLTVVFKSKNPNTLNIELKKKKIWQFAQHQQEDIEQPAQPPPALPAEEVIVDIVHIQLILHRTLQIAVILEVEVLEVEAQELVNQNGLIPRLVFYIQQRKLGH